VEKQVQDLKVFPAVKNYAALTKQKEGHFPSAAKALWNRMRLRS